MNPQIPTITQEDTSVSGTPSASIWTDRRPASRLFEPSPHRRSRAGTLPSRLKPTGIAQSMGSLALVDPPLVENSNENLSAIQTTPPSLTPARSPGLAVPQVNRSRSGSMNANYSPFRPSIWSVDAPRTRANTVSLFGNTGIQPPMPNVPGVGPSPVGGGMAPGVNGLGANHSLNPGLAPGQVAFPGVTPTQPAAAAHTHHSAAAAPQVVPQSQSQSLSIDDLSPVPTSAVWISNVPPGANPAHLQSVFLGADISFLPQKMCALATFDSVQAATDAQRLTNGRELYPGRGPALVGFARETANNTHSPQSVLAALNSLGPATPAEIDLIYRAFAPHNAKKEIPATPDQAQERVYISAVLRDIRKKIDQKQLSVAEIEELALDMLGELPTLVSDYMGNTVVQQLFDYCHNDIKDILLRALIPHLAQAGIHKNGTWAVQKIIDVARTARQKHMVALGLRSYAVPLLLDQYGNYVIQCCLKFGPYADFVYEVLVAEIAEVAHGRFGARAIRACLESPIVDSSHQRVVAAAIVDNAVPLSLNANGSLLVTWLLDAYQTPSRYSAIAQRLLPALTQLCTSKVASLIVQKVLSNRHDGSASRMLLDALFDPSSEYAPDVLKQILSDPHGHGPMFLYKLITTGFAEGSLDRHVAINKIRIVLLQPGSVPPGHKRLLEEVGLAMLLPEGEDDFYGPTQHP